MKYNDTILWTKNKNEIAKNDTGTTNKQLCFKRITKVELQHKAKDTEKEMMISVMMMYYKIIIIIILISIEFSVSFNQSQFSMRRNETRLAVQQCIGCLHVQVYNTCTE